MNYNIKFFLQFFLGFLMVTNSSLEVGCIATQLSKSALVAPIFKATPNPWSISSQPLPIMWRPTTFSSSPAQISFITV